MTESISTIAKLLDAGDGAHPAISAPGGVALTYDGLRSLLADTVRSLRARGIEPNDRVAYVLDNGPEAATTFLSVAAGATAAPLNPAYRADEYEFYLSDLRAKLLIVAQGKDSPSIDVAAKLGVPVARLVAHPERGAGTFTLEFDGKGSASSSRPAPTSPIPTTSRSCCTRQGRRRGRRSCRSPSATCARRRET